METLERSSKLVSFRPVNCVNCGKQILLSDKFCDKCGKPTVPVPVTATDSLIQRGIDRAKLINVAADYVQAVVGREVKQEFLDFLYELQRNPMHRPNSWGWRRDLNSGQLKLAKKSKAQLRKPTDDLFSDTLGTLERVYKKPKKRIKVTFRRSVPLRFKFGGRISKKHRKYTSPKKRRKR